MAPLLYPAHSIALACVYLAALLSFKAAASPEHSNSEYRTSSQVVELLRKGGSGEMQFHSQPEDLQGLPAICHMAPALTANFFDSQEVAHTVNLVMDLLLHEATTSAFLPILWHTYIAQSSTPQSPPSPGFHPLLVSATPPAMVAPSIPHGPDQLTWLKILMMRENNVRRGANDQCGGA